MSLLRWLASICTCLPHLIPIVSLLPIMRVCCDVLVEDVATVGDAELEMRMEFDVVIACVSRKAMVGAWNFFFFFFLRGVKTVSFFGRLLGRHSTEGVYTHVMYECMLFLLLCPARVRRDV